MPAQRRGAASADVSSSGTEEMGRASAIITSAYPPSTVTPDVTGLRGLRVGTGVDLRTVQLWMGHKDLESTMRYLKPARGSGIRDKVNNTFKRPRPMLLRTGS